MKFEVGGLFEWYNNKTRYIITSIEGDYIEVCIDNTTYSDSIARMQHAMDNNVVTYILPQKLINCIHCDKPAIAVAEAECYPIDSCAYGIATGIPRSFKCVNTPKCTCPEDHIHNERGCITGMCSCRIIPIKNKTLQNNNHKFDKYVRASTIGANNKLIFISGACLNCGEVIGSKECIPDLNWRNLQEKQFAFYMEEANKVKAMRK